MTRENTFLSIVHSLYCRYEPGRKSFKQVVTHNELKETICKKNSDSQIKWLCERNRPSTPDLNRCLRGESALTPFIDEVFSVYSHILRTCPGLWEEPVGTRQLAGHLWLSAPPSLWRTVPGWAGLLWVLLLGAPLHAGKELLLESCRETQTSTPGLNERAESNALFFIHIS